MGLLERLRYAPPTFVWNSILIAYQITRHHSAHALFHQKLSRTLKSFPWRRSSTAKLCKTELPRKNSAYRLCLKLILCLSDMIFNVRQTIAWLSQGTTLEPGSIIMTGTPKVCLVAFAIQTVCWLLFFHDKGRRLRQKATRFLEARRWRARMDWRRIGHFNQQGGRGGQGKTEFERQTIRVFYFYFIKRSCHDVLFCILSFVCLD